MLMKRNLRKFAAAALLAVTAASAQAQQTVLVDVTGWSWLQSSYEQGEDGSWGYVYKRLDEPTLHDYNRYYYNAGGAQVMERTSYAQYRYAYNADGTVATREQWSTSGGVFCATTRVSYEYDSEGNQTKQTTQSLDNEGNVTYTSGTYYDGYENGEYTVMRSFSVTDGEEVIGYESHYQLTFNDSKQLVARIQMLPNAETGEYTNPNTFEYNVYENGQLVKTTSGYYDVTAEAGHEYDQADLTITYVYNTDGTVKSRTEINSGRYQSEIEWRYTYATVDPAFVVQNVQAEAIDNNEVYVKWDAVSGAEKYIVMYDNNEAEVEGKTEFITPLLSDGEHQIAVQAVVGGEPKNLSDFVKVSVKDEGNLPMENFKVTAAEKVDVESYGYVSQYYNLTLSWDVPEGASAITDYKVYVDKQNGETWYPSASYIQARGEDELLDNYNSVNTWVTDRQNFYWTTFEDTYYDPDTYETVSLGTGPTCKIWICAVYATGESQPSNAVEVNVYDLANGGDGTGVQNITVNGKPAQVEVYNLKGQRVQNANGRQLYIVRQGNEVKKVVK